MLNVLVFILNVQCLIHANDDNDFNVGKNGNLIKLNNSVEKEMVVELSLFLCWITG
jgi:hypothetical protein